MALDDIQIALGEHDEFGLPLPEAPALAEAAAPAASTPASQG